MKLSNWFTVVALSIGASLALAGSIHATTGSDLAFTSTGIGYEMVDSEESGFTPVAWEDIGPTSASPGTPVAAGWNNTIVPVSFGFTFPYYGGSYASGSLSTNGNLQFGALPSTSAANLDMPFNDAINNVVAPFWDDLCPGASGTIHYASILGDGDPRFIVQWTNVTRVVNFTIFGQAAASLTFQVVIRPSGRIEFNYESMTGAGSEGNNATVGIENASGSDGIRYKYNGLPAAPQDNSIDSGLRIIFFKTTAPNAPTNLVQMTTSGGAAQPIGFVVGKNIAFRGTVSDPDGNQAKLQVEVLPSATAFDPVLLNGVAVSGPLVASGGITEASLDFTTTSLGTGSYHWRARTLDEVGKGSSWADFNAGQAIHFWVDMSPPNAPTPILPGDSLDVNVAAPTGSMVVLECEPATDVGNGGVVSYDFQVAKDAAVSQPVMSGSSATPQISLPLSTSGNFYYWRVRAVDALGNVGAWSVIWKFRVVSDDGIDHAANDAQCAVGVGGGNLGWVAALVIAALLLKKRRGFAVVALSIGVTLSLAGSTHATIAYDNAFTATGAGYEMIDNEEPGFPPVAWQDIGPASAAPGASFPPGWDDLLVPVTFGFNFPFYGDVFAGGTICSNGNLQLGAASVAPVNEDVPVDDAVNGVIAPFWDDLKSGALGGAINYASVLNDGDPRFIVQWTNAMRAAWFGALLAGLPDQACTFQLVIHATGRIEFLYQAMGGGALGSEATVGIENATGQDGIRYGFNGIPNAIYNGLCVAFFQSTAPVAPTNLAQLASSGGAPAPLGLVVSQDLWFRGTITDPQNDLGRLQVEFLPSVQPFLPTAISGSVVTGPLVASGQVSEAFLDMAATPYFKSGSFHWRARTLDDVGTPSGWVEFNASDPIQFWRDVSPPNAPTLKAPANFSDVPVAAATGSIVQIECEPTADVGMAGVVEYEFEISKDAMISQVMNSGSSPTPGVGFPVDESNQFYYWRVRARDAVGNIGPWSAVFQFRAVNDDHVDNGSNDVKCGAGVHGGNASWGAVLWFAAILLRRRISV